MHKNSFPVKKYFIEIIYLFGYMCFCVSFVYSQESDSTQASHIKKMVSQEMNAVIPSGDDSPFTPGDAIQITVYPDTASFPNGIYPIDDQGYVDLPILGYRKVTDKDITKLESLLKKAYVDYLPQPNIQVRPLIRVTLLGGFALPGLYWVDPRENMWSIVNMAGGTLREDGIEKLKWKRNRVTLSKDCVPYFESGESLQKIGFKSGDQIRVTSRPKQRAWDVFRTDVLPALSITFSAIASMATAYIAFETYKDRR